MKIARLSRTREFRTTVSAYNNEGIRLGDLRALVEAADELPPPRRKCCSNTPDRTLR